MQAATIASGGVRIDRDALLDNVARTARGLIDAGIAAGDRVAIIARNSVEFVELTLAAGKTGAFAVPINWHFSPSEIDVLLADCEPAAIFIDDGLTNLLAARWQDHPLVFLLGGSGAASYAAWRDSQSPEPIVARRAPGSIVYTSGTTGRPKGVRRAVPEPEQEARMQQVRSHLYRIEPESRVLVPGPLYHSFPNQFAVHGAQVAAHTEVMARFDAEELLATIDREKITSVALAPIMFVRLLRLPPDVRRAYDVSSLRWAIHAGGPCADDVKRAMLDWWGPIIAEYYGGTETGPLTLVTGEEWLTRPGTCGRPLEQVELRIVDDMGMDVPRGSPGEVFGRLWPYPDFTYHNDPEKRAQVGLGSLVSLGDIGYQDADGYLFLCDRARDMVVSGGVNIYPAEVEKALFALPGVTDCAAFGVPDPEFGENLVAFVCGQDLRTEHFRSILREHIAGFKVPKIIRTVASLERDPSGKLRKDLLRERFLAMDSADG